MVLWVLTLLSVMVAEFSVTARTALRFSRNHYEDVQAAYVARAGVHTAVAGLIDAKGEAYRPAGRAPYGFPEGFLFRVGAEMPTFRLGGGEVQLEIQSEGGKININRAGVPALDWLFSPLALEEERRQILLDSIRDWRDADNLHRLRGAENAYYQSLPEPYTAKNGDFDSPDELLRVRGMTPEIFDAIRHSITVYPKSGPGEEAAGGQGASNLERLDVNSVGPRLLRSIPGMEGDDVERVLELRRERKIRSVGELTDLVGEAARANLVRYLGIQDVPFYTIYSTGFLNEENPVRRTIRAIVKIDVVNSQERFRFLEWREPASPRGGFS
jgi:general secretion pathway protein K